MIFRREHELSERMWNFGGLRASGVRQQIPREAVKEAMPICVWGPYGDDAAYISHGHGSLKCAHVACYRNKLPYLLLLAYAQPELLPMGD